MYEIHIRPCIQPCDLVLSFVHHHPVGHRIGELQQSRVLHGRTLDVSDKIGGQEEIF
jgi:hypothetical protein